MPLYDTGYMYAEHRVISIRRSVLPGFEGRLILALWICASFVLSITGAGAEEPSFNPVRTYFPGAEKGKITRAAMGCFTLAETIEQRPVRGRKCTMMDRDEDFLVVQRRTVDGTEYVQGKAFFGAAMERSYTFWVRKFETDTQSTR